MHPIQQQLLRLSRTVNLASLTLRAVAAQIGRPSDSPQKIKHHLQQLEKRGFMTIDRHRGVMGRTSSQPSTTPAKGRSSQLFTIPIVGAANCGPALLYAEANLEGFLRVSARLIGRNRPAGLYALRAVGQSMNLTNIDGKALEDGDYAIVDSRATTPRDGDIVIAVIDNSATIKAFVDDPDNGQVVLRAQSTVDYQPIHLHPDDDFVINGKVIAVVKTPRQRT